MPQAAAPADRTAFFTEQARRRRHARLWALLCLGLAGGLGAVLSTITGPLALLLLAAMLSARLHLISSTTLSPTMNVCDGDDATSRDSYSAHVLLKAMETALATVPIRPLSTASPKTTRQKA